MHRDPEATHLTTPTVIRAQEGNYFGRVERKVTVRGLHMAETIYESSARIPSHQHESPSFFMPLGGTFIEGCETTNRHTTVRHYSGGDVGFHPPFEAHWLEAPTNSGRGFAIEIGSDWGQDHLAIPAWDRVPRDLSHSPVAWLIGRLYRELHVGDTTSRLVIETLGAEIHAHLTSVARAASARSPRWLRRVLEVLNDHHTDRNAPPTLAFLAGEAGVTPVALIRTFHRHVGVTPGLYLRHLRLAEARRALLGSDRTLVTIALDAGFYDQSHFVRAFKAQSGMTPGEYRRVFRPSA